MPKDTVHFNLEMPRELRDAIEEERLRLWREQQRPVRAAEVVRLALSEYFLRHAPRD